ncbi:D-threo-aldose 1-dehydrogenase [Octadecabacter temperatus]|uniref:Pyridoxal 4-dehydrogenase n=1 Tax=Octadecabacter temperatus TaxID=1458307 RepID=A0A0K0Y2U6_9RHOB|nr:aldo/keto reductase [Octadecabacter temperatus]AKS45207.1 Pyridoxal 4-dehydrogenase [Octadecabacter temperatus]SIN88293.1 D-threo-aldose 1-dehydrogenase [Octadecabacter temperatus]
MKLTKTNVLNNRTRSPIELSQLGFGGAPLGNLYRKIEDSDAQATLDAAWDAGIRYFDTAPQYGLGRSEMRVAEALARFDPDQVSLSTKVGRILEDCEPEDVTPEAFVDVPQKRIVFDFTYDGIMRSYDDSIARLKTDRIDMLFLHDIDAGTHGQAFEDNNLRQLFSEGGYRALSELREADKISAIGAGVNTWQICARLLSEADFDGFLLAGRYTLLEQDPLDTFLPLCIERDVGIILGGPYNSGILATGAIEGARYDYAPAPEEILQRVRALNDVCVAHDTPLIAAALQFPLGHPAVKSVIPGASSPDEVRQNVEIFETPIPDALWSDLKSQGLIRQEAVTPQESLDAS